ncbi:hypothetical protein Q3G72_027493 [Acer saccharum]|nr:hypothetical protein Q3G72_027493 [Acer saccharum]
MKSLQTTCNSGILTQVNLAERKVPASGVCPVCSFDFEMTIHALWSCSELKAVHRMFGVITGWNRALTRLGFFLSPQSLNQGLFSIFGWVSIDTGFDDEPEDISDCELEEKVFLIRGFWIPEDLWGLYSECEW